MSNVLRLAIVDPVDASRDALKSTLLGMDMVWLEAECSRYEFFSDVVAQTHPDIGIVSLNHNPEKALQLVAQLHESSPECSIVVVSSSTDGNLILRQQPFATTDVVFREGTLGLLSTSPHGAYVTDSAAAASAMSTGWKVANGSVSCPDMILRSDSRCAALALTSTIGWHLPLPSWIGPGHWNTTAIFMPSSRTSP